MLTNVIKKRTSNKSRSAKRTDVVMYVLLILSSVVMLLPLVWMIGASLQSSFTALLISPFWPKEEWRFLNYADVLTSSEVNLISAFGMSSLIAIPAVIVGSYVSALVAFAFAKMKFPGRKAVFFLLLGVLMIPYSAIMLPLFSLYANFGWIGTPLPLIIPKMFGNVVMVFFLRQYLGNVNDSIIESARIDGSGYFGIFNKVVLPLIIPALAAQVILWFMGVWNEYLPAYMYDIQTLPIVVAKYSSDVAMRNEVPKVMAASILSMIPVLVVFAVFQRAIIESVILSGVKE